MLLIPQFPVLWELIFISRSWHGTVSKQLAMDWTAEASEFESQQGQEFSPLHVVQTGSKAHLASYPMGNWGSFPGGKAAGAWSWPFISTPPYILMAYCFIS
jgi:hypothetical protein